MDEKLRERYRQLKITAAALMMSHLGYCDSILPEVVGVEQCYWYIAYMSGRSCALCGHDGKEAFSLSGTFYRGKDYCGVETELDGHPVIYIFETRREF